LPRSRCSGLTYGRDTSDNATIRVPLPERRTGHPAVQPNPAMNARRRICFPARFRGEAYRIDEPIGDGLRGGVASVVWFLNWLDLEAPTAGPAGPLTDCREDEVSGTAHFDP